MASALNIHELISAVQHSEGNQCASWKGELRDKVMGVVRLYADACAASPLSSQAISDREVDLDALLRLVFSLIPEDKEQKQ